VDDDGAGGVRGAGLVFILADHPDGAAGVEAGHDTTP